MSPELKRVKEGVDFVKKLKGRIKEVENEFREVEAEMKMGGMNDICGILVGDGVGAN